MVPASVALPNHSAEQRICRADGAVVSFHAPPIKPLFTQPKSRKKQSIEHFDRSGHVHCRLVETRHVRKLSSGLHHAEVFLLNVPALRGNSRCRFPTNPS